MRTWFCLCLHLCGPTKVVSPGPLPLQRCRNNFGVFSLYRPKVVPHTQHVNLRIVHQPLSGEAKGFEAAKRFWTCCFCEVDKLLIIATFLLGPADKTVGGGLSNNSGAARAWESRPGDRAPAAPRHSRTKKNYTKSISLKIPHTCHMTKVDAEMPYH